MTDYVKEYIETFGEDIKKKTRTPAATDLFQVDNNSKELDVERKEIFEHTVAKMLYVSKRARLDISLTIAF